jgi:heat shock protein HtpX
MLVGTMAATLAGAVAMIGNIVKWGAIFGGFGGRSDDEHGNPIALLGMAIVAPIAAMIIQMAISRQNEFEADATAARITGRPRNLASALRRLDSFAHRIPMAVNPAAAQLAIVNPLAALRGGGFLKWFNTHPPTEERVARLEALERNPALTRE